MILQIELIALESRDRNKEGTLVKVIVRNVGPGSLDPVSLEKNILLKASGEAGSISRYLETCLTSEVFEFTYGPKEDRPSRKESFLSKTLDPR